MKTGRFTTAEDDVIRRLWADGCSAAIIAAVLDRSPKSVTDRIKWARIRRMERSPKFRVGRFTSI